MPVGCGTCIKCSIRFHFQQLSTEEHRVSFRTRLTAACPLPFNLMMLMVNIVVLAKRSWEDTFQLFSCQQTIALEHFRNHPKLAALGQSYHKVPLFATAEMQTLMNPKICRLLVSDRTSLGAAGRLHSPYPQCCGLSNCEPALYRGSFVLAQAENLLRIYKHVVSLPPITLSIRE